MENRPGSAGTIGTREVANAEPDGYTLGATSVSPVVIAPEFIDEVDYTTEAFDVFGYITSPPMLIITGPNSGMTTMEDAVERAQSDSVSAATTGANSLHSLLLQRLNEEEGTDFAEVPSDSASEIARGVAEGDYDVGVTTASVDIFPRIESGELDVLAHGAGDGYSHLGDTPSLNQVGYGELLPSTDVTSSLVAPSGIPEDVAEVLESTLSECLSNEDIVESLGEEIVAEEFTESDQATNDYLTLSEAIQDMNE